MRITIKLKLALAFGLIIALLLGAAAFSVSGLANLNNGLTEMVQGPVARIITATTVRSTLMEIIGAEKSLILENDAQKMQAFDAELSHAVADMDGLISEGEKNASTEEKSKYDALKSTWDNFKTQDAKLRELALDNKDNEARDLSHGALRQLAADATKTTQELMAVTQAEMKERQAASAQTYASIRNGLIIAVAAALIFAVGAAVWISMNIARGLGRMMTVANAVAIGDLNQKVEIKTNDEIKDLVETFNGMTDNLRATAALADQVADGDLSVQAKPLSDKDTLGLALQRMVENLRATAKLADQVADGDLMVQPQPLSDKDVMGLALERMVERLRGVVADASAAADNVSSGSQEMSASSEQLSQGATEQ
ncbi:MAG: MCP four helix bundle domain-containing protein, partial [Caulobacteraceae bacterium]|nr:MCP four helix bundle domain-containing protein [Caulobacteraceae bacterium]